MPARISNIFGFYNLYAKAFPGTVFVLAVFSIFPSHDPINLEISAILIAILILLIIIIGFAIGQGLHSGAVLVEQFTFGIARMVYIFTLAVRLFVFGYLSSSDGNEREVDLSSMDLVIVGILTIIVVAISLALGNIWPVIGYIVLLLLAFVSTRPSVSNWLMYLYKPHRELFKDYICKENDLAIEYKRKISNYDWVDEDDLDSQYVTTISKLEFINAGRAYEFQAIFAFCRSMWVILFLFGFTYLGLQIEISVPKYLSQQFHNFIISMSGYDPIITQFIGDLGLIFLGFACIIFGLLFMAAERQYKIWFVEYLLIDFLLIYEDSDILL